MSSVEDSQKETNFKTSESSEEVEKDFEVKTQSSTPYENPLGKGPENTVIMEDPLTINPSLEAPSKSTDSDKGGEWDLLQEKVLNWWGSNEIQNQAKNLRKISFLVLGLLGFLFVLQIYASFLAGIDRIPFASRLLELTGLIWLTWFSTVRLLRSEDRRKLTLEIQTRLDTLLGDADNKT